MEPRVTARGLIQIYEMVWEEVQNSKLNHLSDELKKDITTSIFIQMARKGFK